MTPEEKCQAFKEVFEDLTNRPLSDFDEHGIACRYLEDKLYAVYLLDSSPNGSPKFVCIVKADSEKEARETIYRNIPA